MLAALICFGCATENNNIQSVSFSFDVWDCRNNPPTKVSSNNNDPILPVILNNTIENYAEEISSTLK